MITVRKCARAFTLLAVLLASAPALAAPGGGGGAGLPWESSFQTILDSIQGMSEVFVTIAILVAGLALMFGEAGGMSRKVVYIVVGGASAVGAAGLVGSLFEGASGMLF